MVKICETYAKNHNIAFSTDKDPKKSKTKGMVFRNSEKKFIEPVKLILNNDCLPWVTSAKYLGNKLVNKIDGQSQDIKEKRARYIERNIELNQEFIFAHPEVKSKINHIYNSSFPGSQLWDLCSKNANMLFNSWSVSVRIMWNVPYPTHRYFIEPLSGPHTKTMVYTRYVSFMKSLSKCNKPAVQYLYESIKKDTRTVTGQNIREILILMNSDSIEDINVKDMKRSMNFRPMAEKDKWRLDILKELVNVKHNKLEIDFNDGENFSFNDIDDMINFIATS